MTRLTGGPSTDKGGAAAGTEQLIALTVPELRRLLNTLIRRPRSDPDHTADWSDDARPKPAPPTTEPADRHRHNCRCSTPSLDLSLGPDRVVRHRP